MGIVWDDWQKEILEAEGNICLCSGRQVGKSEIIALKTARYIYNHDNHSVLIISVTEAQAEGMLQKILNHLFDIDKGCVAKGKDKPTKHKVVLKNKSFAVTRALGSTAAGLRGGTFNVVVPDECAYFPSAVWQVLTPMVLTTNGEMWLLSTPNTMEGYFYQAYTNSSFGFKTFHVTSEEVAEKRPEPQRSIMLAYLEREKARMTKLEYSINYLANFSESVNSLFPEELIKNAQVLERTQTRPGEYYLGVDFARMGGDETVFSVFQKINKKFYQRENLVYKYTLTTESYEKILYLNELYNFKQIYVDSGGLGAPIADFLLYTPSTKNKVCYIDNATRSINPDASRTRKLLKEDLYLNALGMLERGEVFLLKDDDIFLSFKSIQIEHDDKNANIKIYGRYSHITEAVIRALWSNHNTRLSLWCR